MTHASVFSGIGGPEVAATMLGWENLFHCEINPFGRAVLDYWYPHSKSYDDITKTDFREWRGKVDVLTGGFPCQPFSYAGKRGGAQDDRYLWPHMHRCINEVRPRWVVAENVAGILTMVEQGEVTDMASQATLFGEADSLRGYQLRETFTLQRICDDLESNGYTVQPVLIPACAVGAPHRRDRVFIVGHRVSDGVDTDTIGIRREELGELGVHGRRDVGTGSDTTSQHERCVEGHRHDDNATPEDTLYGGLLYGQDEKQRSERNKRHAGTGDRERLCGETSGTAFADTDCNGHQSQAESGRPETSGRSDNGGQRNVANTSDIGAGKREQAERKECGRPSLSEFRECYGASLSADGGVCGERWKNFPSVSPVHRGDDGLPFPVDDLTIPFGKWRTESLKAYGNAIVPQVMYEIFRAIEQTEREMQK